MTNKLTTVDPAEVLSSCEAIAEFMADAFETCDVGHIAHALGKLCVSGFEASHVRQFEC
jgi:DNA-binding phage protein